MAHRYLWLMDNGHGGIIDGVYQTAGKRSPVWPDGRQLFEGDFNRDVVARISRLLRREGIAHVDLVPERQDVPLSERVRRANAFAGDGGLDPILVSVHANAGGGTGWEIYTSRGQTKSDAVASVFARYAEENLLRFPIRADYTDGDVDKEAGFTILSHTTMPAVLTENLFMDRLTPDCEFLLSERGRRRIAQLHAEAIAEIERVGI